MKILLDTRNWFAPNYSSIHKYLQGHPEFGVTPISVFHNEIEHGRYSSGMTHVERLSDWFESGKTRYSEHELREMLHIHEGWDFDKIVACDRFAAKMPKQEIIHRASYYVHAWTEILDKWTPDYILHEPVTGLWNYVCYALCQKKGIDYLGVLSTRLTNKFYFTDYIYDRYTALQKRYFQTDIEDLTEKDLRPVRELQEKLLASGMVPEYMKYTGKKPSMKRFVNLPRIIKNIWFDLSTRRQRHVDMTFTPKTQVYQKDLMRFYRHFKLHRMKLFDAVDLNAKYVFFPLHVEPEATTDIWAFDYRDQIKTLEEISNNLPDGYWLYVKEHSAAVGSRPLSYYERIKKIPRVKLISHNAFVQPITLNAAAVVVLSGTVGLEAVIYKRPLIVLGKPFYAFFEEAKRPTSWDQFGEMLESMLAEGYAVDPELTDKFLYCYINAGFSGNIRSFDMKPEYLPEICENLLKCIEEHKAFKD